MIIENLFGTKNKVFLTIRTFKKHTNIFLPKNLLLTIHLKNFLEPAMFCHLAVLI